MSKTTLALIAGLTMAAPAAAFADTGRSSAVEVTQTTTTTKAPAQAQAQDVSSYAEREQDSKQAQDFQGGQTVIIFSGAALVALVLLLILI
jgi:hypothetical protein